jgi:cell division transport system permease protein
MASRKLSYYFNETKNGLRRHGLMVFAAVSTVFISLFLFGGAYLITREVNLVVDFTTEKVEVAVYLKDTISDAERQRLFTTIQNMNEVSTIKYESKQQAFERFKRIFANQPALTQNVSPDALPASFRVKLKDPTKFEVVSAQLQGQPGIERVVDQRSLLKRVFAVSNILRAGALVAALVVLLSAAGLIGNTVRMAVFSRRREIGVMRLVGATNWFIRIPFIIEALIQSLIGAGAAIVTLIIFRRVFLNSIHNSIAFLPVIPAKDLYVMIPMLLGIGVVVAMLASFVAMRRFLET